MADEAYPNDDTNLGIVDYQSATNKPGSRRLCSMKIDLSTPAHTSPRKFFRSHREIRLYHANLQAACRKLNTPVQPMKLVVCVRFVVKGR